MDSDRITNLSLPAAKKSLSFVRPTDSAQPVEMPLLQFSGATRDTVKKLNELAKKHPFCSYYKARKHDPL
jgi:hypothetical protein